MIGYGLWEDPACKLWSPMAQTLPSPCSHLFLLNGDDTDHQKRVVPSQHELISVHDKWTQRYVWVRLLCPSDMTVCTCLVYRLTDGCHRLKDAHPLHTASATIHPLCAGRKSSLYIDHIHVAIRLRYVSRTVLEESCTHGLPHRKGFLCRLEW